MRRHQRIVVLVAVMGAASAISVRLFADDTNTVPAAPPASSIDQKIEQLDQEIQDLKRQRELDQQQAQEQANQAAEKAKQASLVTAGPDGFAVKSADGNFVLRIGGYAQADARFFFDDKALTETDTFLMRRVRPTLEGTVFQDFDFRFMPDFGNGASSSTILQDAWVEWHYWPWLKIRAGKFKVPLGIEWLQRDTWTSFTERGLPSDLVPQRDVGFQVSGDLLDGTVSYSAGIFNGVPDGASGDIDTGDGKDGVARIFAQPFKTTDIQPLEGLGFGVAGSIGDESTTTTTNLPAYKTPGQNTFFTYRTGVAPDGLETRFSPQGYYYWGPLGFLSEYVFADEQMRAGAQRQYLNNTAWQTVGSFVLTGENASYNGVTPRRPFNLRSGGWGAVELVARYSELHVDPDAFNTNPMASGLRYASPITSAQAARDWGIGLNWYLNKDIKLVLDYDETDFNGGTGTATASAYAIKNREPERVLITRVQFVF